MIARQLIAKGCGRIEIRRATTGVPLMTQLVIKPSLVAGSTTRWSYKAVRTIAVHTNVQLTAVLLYRRLTAFLLLQRCCISCPPLLQLLLALADLTWLAYTDFPGTQYQPRLVVVRLRVT